MVRELFRGFLLLYIGSGVLWMGAVAAKDKVPEKKSIKMVRDCTVIEDKWQQFDCTKENVETKRGNTQLFESHFQEYLKNKASVSILLNMIENFPDLINFSQLDKAGDNYVARLSSTDDEILIEALKSVGVSPDKRNVERETLLMLAVKSGDLVNAKNLLTEKNINLRNRRGDTALHLAIMGEDVEMIEMLLSKGAKLTITNSKGLNPVDLAVLQGQAATLDQLLAAGGKINGDIPMYGESTLWREISMDQDSAIMKVIRKYYKKR